MKKLLLFIVAMLAANVIGKAQLTMSIGTVTTSDTIVNVPVYITGADVNNQIEFGMFGFTYDTTKLVYKNLRANYYDTTFVSNVVDTDNGGFRDGGINSSSFSWYIPRKGAITADFFSTNSINNVPTPIRGGLKTKLFDIVFIYHGPGLGTIAFDQTIFQLFGATTTAYPNGTPYTITYEDGGIQAPTTIPAPELKNPLNNATDLSFTPTFVWGHVAGVTGYQLQVTTDTMSATPLIDQAVTDTTYTLATPLQMGTTYYWRAGGVAATTTWSYFHKFTTKTIVAPTVSTTTATNVLRTSAITGGEILSDGNGTITERGVIYGENSNVTWNTKTGIQVSLAATSPFVVALTALSPNTTYFVKAYAINQSGTGLGNEITFTTLMPIFKATLTTKPATVKTINGADLGGVILSAGNGTISERGVFTKVGAGVDSVDVKHVMTGANDFVGTVSNLASTTTYSVKAFAVNEAGTALGNEITFTTLTPITAPTLTINALATNVTDKAATINAEVTGDGNGTVSDRGVIYAKTAGVDMITKLGMVQNGTGKGVFNTNIGGLTANTTYHVKAYAINDLFTTLSSEISFTTLPTIVKATVVTNPATDVNMTTATVSGNVSNAGNGNISARGIVYSVTQNVDMATKDGSTNEGTGVGAFSSSLSGLLVYTTYYAKAYAINEAGIAYGNEIVFQTLAQIFPPTVVTYNASAITKTGAIAAGNVTGTGNTPITEKGILLSMSQNVGMSNYLQKIVCTPNGVGPFSVQLAALKNKTTYYYSAYAINKAGTTVATEVSFETLPGIIAVAPTVETSAIVVSSIKATTAIGGGNITKDGNATVSKRGLIWAIAPGVTMENWVNKTTLVRTGIGAFTSTLSSLNPNTTYYVKAYAENIIGVGLGLEVSFTTLATYATVVTNPVTVFAQNTAVASGNVTNQGASRVTERGIIYATDNAFTMESGISAGSGLGAFDANLNGLAAFTQYFVKAYADNLYGRAYGATVSFTTLQNPTATITLAPLSSTKFPNYANGASETLTYTLSGTFASTNTFVAELSDAYGNFSISNPTVIGQTTATNANGAIAVEFPYNLASGTSYAVRIRSTNPNMIYSNSIVSLKIKPIADYLTNASPSACTGQSVSIGIPTPVTFEGADKYTYSWTSPALLDNATDINPKYMTPTTGKVFTVYFIPKKAGEQIKSKTVSVSMATASFTVSTSTWVIVANSVVGGDISSGAYANPVVSGTPVGTVTKVWYKNSVAPANIIDPATCTFVVGSNVYYMVATDGSGCSAPAKKFTVFKRSYREGEIAIGMNNSFMQVYPTPFENEININATVGEVSSAKVKLVDMLGVTAFEKVLSVNNGVIDATIENVNVNSGAYMLVLETENDVITSKVVRIK